MYKTHKNYFKIKRQLSIILFSLLTLFAFPIMVSAQKATTDFAAAGTGTALYVSYSDLNSDNDVLSNNNRYWIFTKSIPKNAQNIQINSSNPHVASIRKLDRTHSAGQIQIQTYQTGKTIVSVGWLYKGVNYSHTITLTVKKYSNPLRSLKIGKTECKNVFDTSSGTYFLRKAAGKYKISCKPKKGWKIKDIAVATQTSSKNISSAQYKIIKNNSFVRINAKTKTEIIVTLKNKTNKMTETYTIDLG